MPLPDGLDTVELSRHGFTLPQSDGRVRHSKYNSWRLQCSRCNKWFKKATKQGRQSVWICEKCRRKRSQPS